MPNLCKRRSGFFKDFTEWIMEIATDPEHLGTPIHMMIGGFLNVQEQYLDLIEEFARKCKTKYTPEEITSWTRMLIRTYGKIVQRFVEENHHVSQMKLKSQQEVIYELSVPVISLQHHKGLLPIVGAIDTERARHLLEKTISQCAEKQINHLFIDLSGVMIVDTMVALQIFRLVDALKLIGVKTTLSGIRPEVAMTSIQLGLNFNNLDVTGNLTEALKD